MAVGRRKKFKITKAKRYTKKSTLRPRIRYRSVFPILFKLNCEVEGMHPDEVLELLTYLTNKDSIKFLNDSQKIRLRDYFESWGFDVSWIDETFEEDEEEDDEGENQETV